MSNPSLALLVLYTSQLTELLNFYERLGLAFVEERHGKGPVHYSSQLREVVLELYPAKQVAGTVPVPLPGRQTRLGFSVENLDHVVSLLSGSEVVSGPKKNRAVVKDPDGRVVELYGR